MYKIRKAIYTLLKIIFKYHLKRVEKMIEEYFKSNQNLLVSHFREIENNIEVEALNLKKWITNFV